MCDGWVVVLVRCGAAVALQAPTGSHTQTAILACSSSFPVSLLSHSGVCRVCAARRLNNLPPQLHSPPPLEGVLDVWTPICQGGNPQLPAALLAAAGGQRGSGSGGDEAAGQLPGDECSWVHRGVMCRMGVCCGWVQANCASKPRQQRFCYMLSTHCEACMVQ